MLTKSRLSAPRQRLVEILQKTNFGRIEHLVVRDGQPVFEPAPRIVKDVKLGSPDNEARQELEAPDFLLKREHLDLFETLTNFNTGTIEAIEIRHGLPFRILFEQHP